ncbi:unnamed protein product, partial [Ectocarpus sp. 13 AM-2016]
SNYCTGRGGLETQRDRSGKALNMAAGSASWRGLCKQHSKVPPLKLVPFLPQDNNTADMSSRSGQAGSSSGSSSGNTISRANAELGRLLDVGFPTFLSFVLEDESLAKFIDTFLRFRRRHYESTAVGQLQQQQQQQPSEEPAPLQELGRRVFLVLLRAVGPEHASLAKEENYVDSRNGTTRPGELLVADGGMLSPPAVLDVCALYGRSNPSLVVGLLRSLGELDARAAGLSSLAEDLEKAVLAAAGALAEVHAKMAGAQDGLGLGPPIDHTEASDVLSYVTDVAVSVGSLLQASCGARAVGSGGGGGGGGSGSGGGIGLLAQRLQGSDGEVSPEGLAAALALTFEATLPALEGVLLAPISSGKVGAPDSESVRARGRVARQWLLRCLHGLIGPVFLQPLGLQEASPSAAGSGDGDGAGDVGVADGLFSFVTSVTAASGHLAPTGYAGSLLGEYNHRFRLADALDQAQALGTQPIPPLPPSEKQRTPRVGLAPGKVLGPECTEYLTGVLRALPVSEEGVSKEAEAEAEAAAAAGARAMSAALGMG